MFQQSWVCQWVGFIWLCCAETAERIEILFKLETIEDSPPWAHYYVESRFQTARKSGGRETFVHCRSDICGRAREKGDVLPDHLAEFRGPLHGIEKAAVRGR